MGENSNLGLFTRFPDRSLVILALYAGPLHFPQAEFATDGNDNRMRGIEFDEAARGVA